MSLLRYLRSRRQPCFKKAHYRRNDARARAEIGRAEKLERKLRKLEKQIAAMEEADDEVEESSEESDEEEDAEDPTRWLPFALVPRRDERGRWQAESPELRSARMAQLARGVTPSAVTANMEDIISLLAPGVELPAPCERSMRQLRGEVTISSEAMAAWKFAKAKRILFAGWDESTIPARATEARARRERSWCAVR